jgi:hypothetical protein
LEKRIILSTENRFDPQIKFIVFVDAAAAIDQMTVHRMLSKTRPIGKLSIFEGIFQVGSDCANSRSRRQIDNKTEQKNEFGSACSIHAPRSKDPDSIWADSGVTNYSSLNPRAPEQTPNLSISSEFPYKPPISGEVVTRRRHFVFRGEIENAFKTIHHRMERNGQSGLKGR